MSLLLSNVKKVVVLMVSEKLSKLAQDEINFLLSKINGVLQCYYTTHTTDNVPPFLIIHHSQEKEVKRRTSFYHRERYERDLTPFHFSRSMPPGPYSFRNANNRNSKKKKKKKKMRPFVCCLPLKKSAYSVDLAKYFKLSKSLNKRLIYLLF
jgi:hypothetical protein